ncbi:hypothetical protein TSAR_011595, partial [Trichomalopsis sarcophagae]
EEKREALCFRERLDVYSKNNFITNDTGSIVGSHCISVESIGPENREFLLHIFSSMKIDGFLGGSKVISSATEELHCLEEKRIEFIHTNDGMLEKKLYVTNGEDYYSIKVTNDFLTNENRSFNIYHKDSCKLISDGCSILLMRYLAITDFHGSLSFDFITIDGKLMICNYECFCSKLMKIDSYNLDVYMIRQTFCENERVFHENKICMTKNGKIIHFDWVDSSFIMKINPSFDLMTCSKGPIIMPLREKWPEDMELTSKYKDKRVICDYSIKLVEYKGILYIFQADKVAEQERYLSLHREIYDIMADYVQTLLCRKPEDILQFTINYFKTMIYDPTSNENLLQAKSNFWNITDTTNLLKDEMNYLLINDVQHENNSICSNGSCTQNTSLASLVSNHSTCSFCSNKSENKSQCK